LILAVVLVTLLPFVPLLYLTWSGYREDIARVEGEIRSSNEDVANLASHYVEQLVQQMEQAAAAASKSAPPVLPRGPSAVAWEHVEPGGNVLQSTLSPQREGRPCGYERFLAQVGAGESKLSDVYPWLAEAAPTGLHASRLALSEGWVVGILEPEVLRRTVKALSGDVGERHVYLVDRQGHVLFYSDLAQARAGVDMRKNPPMRMLQEGGSGPIRFDSVVSGRERLGYVRRAGTTGWGVVVTADGGLRVLDIRSRYLALVCSTVFGVLVALLILLWTTRRLGRPLLQIRDALRDSTRAPFQPLAVPESARSVAEHDELIGAFDELCRRAASTEKELLHAERVASVGQLASGLAHEIGTPLNIIKGSAQHALRRPEGAGAARATLELVVAQTERIADLIRRLLDYARPAESRMVPLDLTDVVTQALEMIRGLNARVEIRVDIDPETPPVIGDPTQLEQAVMNLLVNAYQAMPEGGWLSVIVGQEAHPDTQWVCCTVVDSGCGIWPDAKEKLFQPFFTTKGQGTGLGLAIVDRIVRRHGARIEVGSRHEGGTIFSLHLKPAQPAMGGTAVG
jgi:signal transduction histidine kinase